MSLYLVLKLGFAMAEYKPIQLFEDIDEAKQCIKTLREKERDLKYKYEYALFSAKLERIYDDKEE